MSGTAPFPCSERASTPCTSAASAGAARDAGSASSEVPMDCRLAVVETAVDHQTREDGCDKAGPYPCEQEEVGGAPKALEGKLPELGARMRRGKKSRGRHLGVLRSAEARRAGSWHSSRPCLRFSPSDYLVDFRDSSQI